MEALERPGAGEVFTAVVRAIEARDAVGLDRLLTLAEALPDAGRGSISAFGWVEASRLKGITAKLLESPVPFRRLVGLASCAMHRVDAGAAAVEALSDDDAALRARALRIAADQGRLGLLQACLRAMADDDPECAFEATRAAVFLGDRRAAEAELLRAASVAGPSRLRSICLFFRLCAPAEAHPLLQAISHEPADMRLLVRAVGIAGDPHHVPWLLRQMQEPGLARLAGESFSFIAGLDLADARLERKPPDNFEPGPNDDADDDNTAMDEDDGLPWPDTDAVSTWWSKNGHGFQPGVRHFMGAAISPAHCFRVLKRGGQRQRTAAAEHLCLLRPGTWLFPTHAPAWRQAQWLDAMGTEGAGP